MINFNGKLEMRSLSTNWKWFPVEKTTRFENWWRVDTKEQSFYFSKENGKVFRAPPDTDYAEVRNVPEEKIKFTSKGNVEEAKRLFSPAWIEFEKIGYDYLIKDFCVASRDEINLKLSIEKFSKWKEVERMYQVDKNSFIIHFFVAGYSSWPSSQTYIKGQRLSGEEKERLLYKMKTVGKALGHIVCGPKVIRENI